MLHTLRPLFSILLFLLVTQLLISLHSTWPTCHHIQRYRRLRCRLIERCEFAGMKLVLVSLVLDHCISPILEIPCASFLGLQENPGNLSRVRRLIGGCPLFRRGFVSQVSTCRRGSIHLASSIHSAASLRKYVLLCSFLAIRDFIFFYFPSPYVMFIRYLTYVPVTNPSTQELCVPPRTGMHTQFVHVIYTLLCESIFYWPFRSLGLSAIMGSRRSSALKFSLERIQYGIQPHLVITRDVTRSKLSAQEPALYSSSLDSKYSSLPIGECGGAPSPLLATASA